MRLIPTTRQPAAGVTKESRGASRLFYALAAFASLTIGLYLGAFHEMVGNYQSSGSDVLPASVLSGPSYGIAVLVAAIVFAAMLALDRNEAAFRKLIRGRYLLSAAILILFCALGMSGSSLEMWSSYLGDDGLGGTVFGIPRGIRSDEWGVSTPFALSQVETGNQVISPVIRGGGTDTTLSPALPSWSFPTLFRPYFWGYLVLGLAGGLAFSWMGRMLALALVTFEFAKLVTNGDEALSVCAAILVTFAPVVQWWNAPNLLVFGQGLVLCLNALLESEKARSRWLFALLLSYLLCCYALELYPAWMVPMFYVFASAGVWACFKVKASRGVSWKGLFKPAIVPIIAAFAACAAVAAFCIWSARDVVAITGATVYPGQRSETGGGGLSVLLSYFCNGSAMPVAPLMASLVQPNVCEAAVALALFPLGGLLLIVRMVRARDLSSLFLLVPYLFLTLFAVVGFPGFLSRVTLMSSVPVGRLAYPLGFLDVMMLVRACSMSSARCDGEPAVVEKRLPARFHLPLALLAAVAYAAAAVLAARQVMGGGAATLAYLIVFGFSAMGAFIVLLPETAMRREGRSRGRYLLLWSAVVLCAGLCVNPLHCGSAELVDDDVVEMVEAVAESDPDGVWVSDDSFLAQACAVAGAKTINTVNTYPNLDLWHRIDPEGDYEYVYNRYAHIVMEMADAGETPFELMENDRMLVRLDGDALEQLGIDYWLSRDDLTESDSGDLEFEPIGTCDGLTVYQVHAGP